MSPALEELVLGEALRLEGLRSGPAARREADAEARRRGLVEAPLAEEPAPRLGLRRRELRDEELLGGRVRREDAGAAALVALRAAVLVVELVADPGGESLDGLRKVTWSILMRKSKTFPLSPQPKQW